MTEEMLISVDVEASGDSPSTGSLLSIGACLVTDPTTSIYVELKPVAGLPWSEEAEGVHGLTVDHLNAAGLEPADGMAQLEAWVQKVSVGRWPIFVGFNAPFDWMFVADYFWRYLGRNPFGVSALDLKSLYMGRDRVSWADTRKVNIAARLDLNLEPTHNALDDARDQARLARELLQRPHNLPE
jgi:ribonuclease T